jgi:hypothetical protein
MARLEDISEGEREMLKTLPLPSFETTPFVRGKPLSQRRVSILSTAALQRRDYKVFWSCIEEKPVTASFPVTPRPTTLSWPTHR